MSNKHFGENDLSLLGRVYNYYKLRGLKFPSFDNAMKFLQTELAEVYELDLARIGGWERNNPQNKPSFSPEKLAEELGDAIMMLIVAGIAEGVDPVDALKRKMERKLDELRNEQNDEIEKAASIKGKMELISEEEAYDYFQDDLNFDAERERRSR